MSDRVSHRPGRRLPGFEINRGGVMSSTDYDRPPAILGRSEIDCPCDSGRLIDDIPLEGSTWSSRVDQVVELVRSEKRNDVLDDEVGRPCRGDHFGVVAPKLVAGVG